MRAAPRTPAVPTCREDEDPGGGFGLQLNILCFITPIRRSVKDLIRKYDLELTASTFLILDSDPTSLEIACEWQRCMGGQVTTTSLSPNISVHILILIILIY